MSGLPFFDSLTHVSGRRPWLDEGRYDASLERFLREARRHNPYRACLVNIAHFQDNAELEEVAGRHRDLVVPIAGFDPVSYTSGDEIDAELGRLAGRGFAGVKLHPRLNRYDPLDDRVARTIHRAGALDLVVFLDTLFRQTGLHTRHPADVVDRLATGCEGVRMILLHGGGAHLMPLYEIVRMRSNLLLDLSFTLHRYAGSSLDADIRFVCSSLDQRVVLGSDFPEYTPVETLERFHAVVGDLPQQKLANILNGNLERLFEGWQAGNSS